MNAQEFIRTVQALVGDDKSLLGEVDGFGIFKWLGSIPYPS